MRTPLLLLFLSLPLFGFSILEYQKGDTLFIWAKSGLHLREDPASWSQVIQTIPFGKAVVVQQEKNYYARETYSFPLYDDLKFKISNPGYEGVEIRGMWVKVFCEGKEGYLFDGYLSSYPPPRQEEGWKLEAFLSRVFSVTKLSEWDQQQDEGLSRFTFANGAFFKGRYASGGYSIKFVFPEMALEEAYLLCLYFYPPDPETYITQLDENTVRFSHDLGDLTITYINETVVIQGGWGC